MMTLLAAAAAMNGVLLGDDGLFESVGTDSRNITKGELFFALKGENFDGEQYATEALKKGAAAVVITNQNNTARPAILVNNAKLALGDLASVWVENWRSEFKKPVVAITGSNGKTTTKEMLTAILATTIGSRYKVHATHGNLNNDIGVPLTLLKLRPEHAYAVVEMGMNHLKEIDYLTRLTKPDIALINNAGTAHIGELGSIENIAQAKGEIFAGLALNGKAVINQDSQFAAYWKNLNVGREIVTFGITTKADVMATYTEHADASDMTLTTPKDSVRCKLNILGAHNISNALAASAAAFALGVSSEDIQQGLSAFDGVYGRLQRKAGLNGAVLIDDTYNANPDSMKAAINVLASQPGDKVLVLGAMGELGEASKKMHVEIGVYAKSAGLKTLYCLGDMGGEMSREITNGFGAGGQYIEQLADLENAIKSLLNANTTVLIKGSRFTKMERVVAMLQEELIQEKLVQKKSAITEGN